MGPKDDLDGEAIECDIDGVALADEELNGETFTLLDSSELVRLIEASKRFPDDCLGGKGLDGNSAGFVGSMVLREPTGRAGEDDVIGEVVPEIEEKLEEEEAIGGIKTPSPPRDTKDKELPSDSEAGGASDLERQESGDKEEKDESPKEEEKAAEPELAPALAPPRAPMLDEAAVKKRQEDRRLRNIEIQVEELRQTLEEQGVDREAIGDICKAKRERLLQKGDGEEDSDDDGLAAASSKRKKRIDTDQENEKRKRKKGVGGDKEREEKEKNVGTKAKDKDKDTSKEDNKETTKD